MTVSSQQRTWIEDRNASVADVLLVRVSPAAIVALQPDSFSQADSGAEALGMLKLLRFQLLVASLDIPDMRPWELFLKARRAQARLQCVLLDEHMTHQDERRVRQVGAGAFASSDPAICAALVRSSPPIIRAKSAASDGDVNSSVPNGPARAPP
jgi:DNA-binding NarL/FixJ family response regulator